MIGERNIDAYRRIVERKQYEEVDGVMVDLQTAHRLVTVYEALKPENQEKFTTMSTERLGRWVWTL